MMKMKELKNEMLSWIDHHQEEFSDIAKYIWENPELGLEEYEASDILVKTLEKYGFQVKRGLSGMPTSFIAEYGNGKPIIAYNAEYDCLPGLSQECMTDNKKAIIKGAPGHGCGHNILGTSQVLAAVALRFVLEEKNIPGTIKVFGSPAEELCVGKPFMAKDGCYKNVDCFLDWHPWSYNKAHYDTCGAYFSVKYHFKGKNCHGNSPWQGRSALDAAILMGTSIEFLREHYEPAAADRANTINYTFSETGPEFPSVVPDKATLWCIGRFNTSKQLEDILDRVDKCAQGGALATDTSVEREFITASHEKIPNKILSRVLYDNFVELGAPAFTEEEQSMARSMQKADEVEETGLDTDIMEFGTSGTVLCDTSEFSWNAPYATFWMTAAPEGGWHNWKVTSSVGSSIGMKSMIQAAKLLAVSGIDLFLQPDIIVKAQKEWCERMNGRTYRSLLPEGTKPPLGINAETMDKYKSKK
ncbi:amidohydrolase [[Clostridium] fimetarium]|uniref:Aminobenzoyl-glutamate utilization protein B n=1 Tax=[Clostridium] fimetarium TaxID=99656 RepID=A0A1I0RTA3_9FIRM|nr:amidohydrolase [[Clostridium] fimetarium]SEW44517.1 aminobenzoyl-glutamate utilization protein B [[Clostridium] fimetarium]